MVLRPSFIPNTDNYAVFNQEAPITYKLWDYPELGDYEMTLSV
jgi:hypothetical protein